MKPQKRASLWPFTWTRYDVPRLGVTVESVGFSPLLPSPDPERGLPLYLSVFRVHNPTDTPSEAALMLTWEYGWPEPIEDAEFDFQHDNLCLTGSLGSPKSANRQGIAVPDLHYVGIYLQGIEPWSVPADSDEILADFAGDGELDSRITGAKPHGAAAWVKFDLEPRETKEIPFVLAWHVPIIESGIGVGEERHYTQMLGRVRPDNAIVWLAEQAVNHFGAETANYRYWMARISDWHQSLEDSAASICGGIDLLLQTGTVWRAGGKPTLNAEALRDVDARVIEELRRIWPDLA